MANALRQRREEKNRGTIRISDISPPVDESKYSDYLDQVMPLVDGVLNANQESRATEMVGDLNMIINRFRDSRQVKNNSEKIKERTVFVNMLKKYRSDLERIIKSN